MNGITASAPERKGRPLWAVGGLLLCWIAVRFALFEMPPGLLPQPIDAAHRIVGLVSPGPLMQSLAATNHIGRPGLPAFDHRPLDAPASVRKSGYASQVALPLPWQERAVSPVEPLYDAVGNNSWMTAMGAVPLAPDAAEMPSPKSQRATPSASPSTNEMRRSHWSGDAWLAWRSGTAGLVGPGPAVPVYGASQAGALLRYELVPGSPIRPSVYVRAVRAADRREGDVAAGIAARPLASVPVTVHGEARLSRRGPNLELRPAIFASGGMDAVPLAGGVTARGYAQAGYVGGHDATAFADGSLLAEKTLWLARGGSELTAGTGAWGGAQRGTARLDFGPTASLRFPLGEGSARVSADYRLRVAGNAEPSSGVALTLSAGF